MFGLPVVRTQTYEVSGIGSAISAFVTLGVFEDYREALRCMVHKKMYLNQTGGSMQYTRNFMRRYISRYIPACQEFMKNEQDQMMEKVC